MTHEEKFERMTEAPVKKLICSLAVPTIISMLVTSFYNMADTFFVGRIDTESTAAVGVVFSMMAVIQAIGFFFGHGSGNYIARKLGAQNVEEAEKMATTGFGLAFLTGVALAALGLCFLAPLTRLLGATPEIAVQAQSYLRIILLGAPFMTSSLVLSNQMRFQGNAAFAMVGIVAGALVNIALDPLFIFGFDMGVAGAALATVISQLGSFLLLLFASKRGGNICIRLKNFQPSGRLLREMCRGGLPSLCRQGLGSLATVLLNVAAGAYGSAAIAGMSIVTRITMFINSSLIGFGQGFQPVCGFNYGAKKYDRVREGFWFCAKVGFGVLLIAAMGGCAFAPQLVELFRKGDPAVVEVGALALRLQLITMPLSAWLVVGNMMLQSIGKSFKASILAMARQGLFFVPLILILPRLFGLIGVQTSQAAADVLSFLLTIPLVTSVLREMKEAQR